MRGGSISPVQFTAIPRLRQTPISIMPRREEGNCCLKSAYYSNHRQIGYLPYIMVSIDIMVNLVKSAKTEQLPPHGLPWWQRPFAIDLRSLALVRIGLGLLLLTDLAFRWPDLVAHYSDSGVLPRVALESYYNSRPGLASFHMLFGSVEAIAALFAVAATIALAFTVGYRTRLTGFLSLVFLCSLQARNPFVLSGGDSLLRMLLFWMLFLPAGARYAFDARRGSNGARLRSLPSQHVSIGGAALLLQMAMMYWFSAILKDHPSWRSNGDALFLALSIDQFVKPFGRAMLAWPEMLRVLTLLTFWLEVLGPIAAFVTAWRGRIRMAAILAFLGFHLIALNLTLELGLFPWVCAVGWLAFLPTRFWEVILPAVHGTLRDFFFPRTQTPLPQLRERSITPRKSIASGNHFAANAIALTVLLFVVCWNVRTTNFERHEKWFPRKVNVIAQALRIEQYWSMFSPYPMHDDGWLVARCVMSDGNEIDLITGKELDLRKPAQVARLYSSQRWRKYCMNLRRDTYRVYRAGYVRWLIRQYEDSQPLTTSRPTLVAVRLTYMREQTLPDVLAEAMPHPMQLFETVRPGAEVVASTDTDQAPPESETPGD